MKIKDFTSMLPMLLIGLGALLLVDSFSGRKPAKSVFMGFILPLFLISAGLITYFIFDKNGRRYLLQVQEKLKKTSVKVQNKPISKSSTFSGKSLQKIEGHLKQLDKHKNEDQEALRKLKQQRNEAQKQLKESENSFGGLEQRLQALIGRYEELMSLLMVRIDFWEEQEIKLKKLEAFHQLQAKLEQDEIEMGKKEESYWKDSIKKIAGSDALADDIQLEDAYMDALESMSDEIGKANSIGSLEGLKQQFKEASKGTP